jgi:UPF0176 protein
MFCTGGIRCERLSAICSAKALPRFTHLKGGGILKYPEDVPQEQTMVATWFDNRVTVRHDLLKVTMTMSRVPHAGVR